MGTRQTPKLKGALTIYHIAMLPTDRGRRYELVAYGKDRDGRKWCARVALTEKPELLGGERVFDDEIVEVDE